MMLMALGKLEKVCKEKKSKIKGRKENKIKEEAILMHDSSADQVTFKDDSFKCKYKWFCDYCFASFITLSNDVLVKVN